MSDKDNLQSSQSFTEKDIDDWFETLKGKSIEGAKPEIQKDATVLRELLINSREQKRVKTWNNSGFMPYAAFASIFVAIFSVLMISPLNPWHSASVEKNYVRGLFSTEEARSAQLVATDNPIEVKNLDDFITMLSKTLNDDLELSEIPFDGGILIAIHIVNQPDLELAEKLKTYGFKPEMGEQYLYFIEKEQQD